MQNEAIFENIANRIQLEIEKARQSIFIAVAWFTNQNIFNALVAKTNEGCRISLIISDDDINRNSTIDFEKLNQNGSAVYWVGKDDKSLMHNKFCVIDHSTVITGSYNWSYKAERNFENVVITRNDTVLAEQYIAEFNKIRNRFYIEEQKENFFPLQKIIKRLEILMNYILLEDIQELRKEIIKLNKYSFNADLKEIIEELNKEEFAASVKKIQQFISGNQQLLIWTDPVVAGLKLEIKNLENQLNAFDNEKTELEKLLSEFQHRHVNELGEIILEILKLRKIKFQNDKTKFDEAENNERQYREQVDIEKKKKIFELTDEQKTELKKNFRKATHLCHPDKVSDEYRETAHKIFIELKNAYDLNDLKKVTEILEDLEKGNFLKSRSETVTEKELLKSAIAKLRIQIKTLETEIISIKENDTYRFIKDITDWDEYFKVTKEKLQRERDDLEYDLI